jgi:hypothetical protein
MAHKYIKTSCIHLGETRYLSDKNKKGVIMQCNATVEQSLL